MEKITDAIEAFFKKNEWKYNYDAKENIFISGVNMGNVLGSVKIYIIIEKSSYNVYVILNSKVEKKYYASVAEFLHRANYGLNDGNFEMDYRDGEVRYKSYVNFRDCDISEAIIEESIIVGLAMIKRYGKGLLKLMLGEGIPEECVKMCEKRDQL